MSNGAELVGELVSANYFETLGLNAAIGRVLVPDDDDPDAGGAVVLSDKTWRKHFASQPGVIGKQVSIANQDFTIAGVAPSGFQGTRLPSAPAFWIPIKKTAAML
ncbi:MAG: ABC transporter permease [Blastocatellia bacterium]